MTQSGRLLAEVLYPAWEDHCYEKANGRQDHPHKPAITGGKARYIHTVEEELETIVCTYKGCTWYERMARS